MYAMHPNTRSRSRVCRALALIVLLTLLAAGCAQSAPAVAPSSVPATITASAGDEYWPTAGWRTSPPAAQHMDAQKLDLLLQEVRDEHLDLHSLLIIRNGYIVSETYFAPYTAEMPHELYSVTKSIVGTLVGIAIDQQRIDGVNQPIADFFRSYRFDHSDVRKEAMTIEDVLTMRSGLDWREEDATFGALYQSRYWVQFMLDIPMAEQPGRQFRYCSGCSHLLSAIVQQRTGMNTRAFAQQSLFGPLGIHAAAWEQDPQRMPIGGWGLQLTPRDMAKLGYLYLHNGSWDGQQIVSAEWARTAVQRHTGTDSEVGLGYGYQWWAYPRFDAYAALGRYGQTIFVVPKLQLIVVTTAALEGHEPIFNLIERYIVPAVS